MSSNSEDMSETKETKPAEQSKLFTEESQRPTGDNVSNTGTTDESQSLITQEAPPSPSKHNEPLSPQSSFNGNTNLTSSSDISSTNDPHALKRQDLASPTNEIVPLQTNKQTPASSMKPVQPDLTNGFPLHHIPKIISTGTTYSNIPPGPSQGLLDILYPSGNKIMNKTKRPYVQEHSSSSESSNWSSNLEEEWVEDDGRNMEKQLRRTSSLNAPLESESHPQKPDQLSGQSPHPNKQKEHTPPESETHPNRIQQFKWQLPSIVQSTIGSFRESHLGGKELTPHKTTENVADTTPSGANNKKFDLPKLSHISSEVSKQLQSYEWKDFLIMPRDLEESKSAQTSPPIFEEINLFFKSCLNQITTSKLMKIEEFQFYNLPTHLPFLETERFTEISPMKLLAHLHASSVGEETGFLFKILVKENPKKSEEKWLFIEKTSTLSSIRLERNSVLIPKIRETMLHTLFSFYDELEIPRTEQQTNTIKERVQAVSDFFISLRKINEKKSVKNTQPEPINLEQLQKKTDAELKSSVIQISWYNFFKYLYEILGKFGDTMLHSSAKIIVLNDQSVFEETLKLISETNHETFVLAMWWLVFETIIENGSKQSQETHRNLETNAKHILSRSRKDRCFNWILKFYGLFVEHILVDAEKILDKEQEVRNMVFNIKDTYNQYLSKVQWLDEDTKRKAFEKLSKVKVNIIKLHDKVFDPVYVGSAYETTGPKGTPFMTRLSKLYRMKRKYNLLQIQNESTNTEAFDSLKIKISFHPYKLRVDIPIALLGYPFYNLGLDSLNYGSLGTYIASVIWFAFDEEGCKINHEGHTIYWWSTKTNDNFKRISNGFKNYYIRQTEEEKEVENYMDVDEIVRQSIANFTGFEISLKSYTDLMKNFRKSADSDEPSANKMPVNKSMKEMRLLQFGFSDEKMLFTMAFARRHCLCGKEKKIENQVIYTSATFNKLQVNGTSQLSKSFKQIWKCSDTIFKNEKSVRELWP